MARRDDHVEIAVPSPVGHVKIVSPISTFVLNTLPLKTVRLFLLIILRSANEAEAQKTAQRIIIYARAIGVVFQNGGKSRFAGSSICLRLQCSGARN